LRTSRSLSTELLPDETRADYRNAGRVDLCELLGLM
jgi:hypothetical protein